MNNVLVRFLRREWLQLLLVVLPLAAVLVAMPHASERVPMQWDIHGNVNWTAPKQWGLLVLPLMSLGNVVLLLWLESRDAFRTRDDGSLSPHGRAVRTIRLGISIVLALGVMLQLAAALDRNVTPGNHVPVLIGLIIAFLGNFMGKLKPNRYVGIRLPWTLRSEEVWRITHRFAGWLYVSTGLAMAAIGWLLPGLIGTPAVLVWIGALVLVPAAVAWQAARGR